MIVKGYIRGHDIDFSGEKTRLNTKLIGKLKSLLKPWNMLGLIFLRESNFKPVNQFIKIYQVGSNFDR